MRQSGPEEKTKVQRRKSDLELSWFEQIFLDRRTHSYTIHFQLLLLCFQTIVTIVEMGDSLKFNARLGCIRQAEDLHHCLNNWPPIGPPFRWYTHSVFKDNRGQSTEQPFCEFDTFVQDHIATPLPLHTLLVLGSTKCECTSPILPLSIASTYCINQYFWKWDEGSSVRRASHYSWCITSPRALIPMPTTIAAHPWSIS